MKIEKYPINKYYENDNDVKCVVVHVDLGTENGTKNHLKNVASASYHDYIPKREGVAIEFVDTKHGAWHAGKKSNPNEKGEKALSGLSANRNSYGLCLESKPVDKDGNITFDWSKAVDGEMPSDDQIERAVELIKLRGFDKLMVISHKDITSYKPAIVDKVVSKIDLLLNKEDTCSIENFSEIEILKQALVILQKYAK